MQRCARQSVDERHNGDREQSATRHRAKGSGDRASGRDTAAHSNHELEVLDMTNEQLDLTIDRADKLADLLEHVGWEDVLKPELVKYRRTMETALVRAVLGGKVIADGAELSKEQIAARAEAITYIQGRIEQILKDGAQSLKSLGFSGEVHYA